MELMIPHRWALMVRAAFLISWSRQRSIYPRSLRQPFSAHVREVKSLVYLPAL